MINKRCFPLCLSLFLLLLSSVAFADNGFSGSMGEGDGDGQSSSVNVITPGQGERIVSRPQTAEGVVPQAPSNYDDDVSNKIFLKLELAPAYYMALGSSTFCPARVINGIKCEITSNKAFGYMGSFAVGMFLSKSFALFSEIRIGQYFPKYKSKASARFSNLFAGGGMASRFYLFNLGDKIHSNWMKGIFLVAGAGLFAEDLFTTKLGSGEDSNKVNSKKDFGDRDLLIYGIAGAGIDFALLPTFRIGVALRGGYVFGDSVLWGSVAANVLYTFR